MARWTDPVDLLRLEGTLIGSMPCPHMYGKSLRDRRKCGQQAFLFRYPDPYGLRSRCEDGHVEIMSPKSIPGFYQSLKGPTD